MPTTFVNRKMWRIKVRENLLALPLHQIKKAGQEPRRMTDFSIGFIYISKITSNPSNPLLFHLLAYSTNYRVRKPARLTLTSPISTSKGPLYSKRNFDRISKLHRSYI